MTGEKPAMPQQEESEALARIALTHDGRLLHRYLRRILESRTASNDFGALSRHEGARILAGDLMGHMAPTIEAKRDGSDAEQSILSRPGGAVAVARARGTSRRVAIEPGDGWSPDPEPRTGRRKA